MGRHKPAKTHETKHLLFCGLELRGQSYSSRPERERKRGRRELFDFGGLPLSRAQPMAGRTAGGVGVAPAMCNSSRISKRRPRCRIGLWALVATALSLASCKASRPASARAGLDVGLPLAGEGGGGAWAAAGQLRGGAQGGGKGRSSSRSRQQEDKHAQRETLYDAYNMLHTLAQVRSALEATAKYACVKNVLPKWYFIQHHHFWVHPFTLFFSWALV